MPDAERLAMPKRTKQVFPLFCDILSLLPWIHARNRAIGDSEEGETRNPAFILDIGYLLSGCHARCQTTGDIEEDETGSFDILYLVSFTPKPCLIPEGCYFFLLYPEAMRESER